MSATGKISSTTALFTTDFRLSRLPIIYIISVKVRSETVNKTISGGWEPVNSRQLKRAVIQDWVDEWLPVGHEIAIKAARDKYGAPGDWILQLLTGPGGEGLHYDELQEQLTHAFRTVPAGEVKTKRKVRNAADQIEEYQMICTPDPDLYYAEPGDPQYWELLDTYLRQQVTANGIENGTCNSSGEVLIEAIEDPPPTSLTAMSARPTLRTSPELSVLIRAQGGLEAGGPRPVYRVELDLVPGVRKGKNVADLVHGVFGYYISSESSLVDLRTMLVGMEVRKKNDRPRPMPATDPVYAIRAVELPTRVKPFRHEGKKFSVQKYIETIIFPGKKLRYPDLPLARIGRNAWVPLEMLSSAHTQNISVPDMMNDILEDLRMGDDFRNKQEPMEVLAIDFIRKSSNSPVIPEMAILLDRLLHPRKLLPRPAPNTVEADRHDGDLYKREQRIAHPMPTIGFLFVGSSQTGPDKLDDYMQTLRHRLVKSDNNVFDTSIDFKTQILEKSLVLLIPPRHDDAAPKADIGTLFDTALQNQNGHSIFQARKPQVLIAILDPSGREGSDIAELRNKVFSFGHTNLGAATHFTTMLSLAKLEDESSSEKSGSTRRFPQEVLRTVNLMMGGRNYDGSELEDTSSKKPIMVVGARITHPGSKPSKNSYSVAAVVASQDPYLVHYPRSVRLQKTLKEDRDVGQAVPSAAKEGAPSSDATPLEEPTVADQAAQSAAKDGAPSSETSPLKNSTDDDQVVQSAEEEKLPSTDATPMGVSPLPELHRSGKDNVELCILSLEEMMVERFETWKSSNKDQTPEVVFYREGLSKPSAAIVVSESKAIASTFSQVFSKDLPALSYILVHKSATGCSEPQWDEPELRNKCLLFSTSNLRV